MRTIGLIKRGDSFSFTATLTDEATGAALAGAAAKLKCNGSYSPCGEEVLVEMVVSETVEAGTYLFEAPAGSTDEWVPDSSVYFDIEYTDAGKTSSTETFYVKVKEDVT